MNSDFMFETGGMDMIKNYGSRKGYVCRLVGDDVECRFAPERDMHEGEDYMLLNDDGRLWGIDAHGFSDPLMYWGGRLLYDHPERFPDEIRLRFNELMSMMESRGILEQDWVEMEDL